MERHPRYSGHPGFAGYRGFVRCCSRVRLPLPSISGAWFTHPHLRWESPAPCGPPPRGSRSPRRETKHEAGSKADVDAVVYASIPLQEEDPHHWCKEGYELQDHRFAPRQRGSSEPFVCELCDEKYTPREICTVVQTRPWSRNEPQHSFERDSRRVGPLG